MNEEIIVYRIQYCDSGSYIEKDINNILDMIKDSDVDSVYTITKKNMKQKEYDSLPEFSGF